MAKVEDSSEDALRAAVSDSGFPLQLAVRTVVQRLHGQGWNLLGTEFPWRDEATRTEGYVDLLISNGVVVFAIECKRRSSGNWTFLVEPRQKWRRQVNLLVARGYPVINRPHLEYFGWAEEIPESPEAEHCAVMGSSEGRRRSLEPLANQLVTATECIARTHRGTPWGLAFIPMIVCTPSPAIVHVDPEKVAIEDGSLSGGEQVELAKLVRFRKAFNAWTEAEPARRQRESDSASVDRRALLAFGEDCERTVLVVHAPAFEWFLSSMRQTCRLSDREKADYWSTRLDV